MPRIRKRKNATITPKKWKIGIYIRLSKEDWKEDSRSDRGRGGRKATEQSDTDVSRSIVEQKKILEEYVEQHFQGDDYIIVDYYQDDGLTGTDDTRDDFQRMMADVEAGVINCIIVKTLSRAFRNYADQGRYLEQVFPRKGVRFISTGNPFVDSYKDPDAIQNGMEIPINGLMNDRYAAKTSADVRRTFDAKRSRGEFIGAFAPYGFIKDPEDKNRLIVDEEAAQIVRNIFTWFVNDGMSKRGIAKKLNEMGVPNPTAYKNKILKQNYSNAQSAKNDGLWCSTVILSMLKNEMYIGNMVQGRNRIISYKVHTQISVPEEEWFVVPDTHKPVVNKELFEKAQFLHSRDTRTAPDKKEVYLFAGLLRCADCKKAMRRKSSKERVYYHCRTLIDKGQCTKHVIREDRLTQAVLDAIRIQIDLVNSLAETIDTINQNPTVKTQSNRLNSMLRLRDEEFQKIITASDDLYLDWKSGVISKTDYQRMKSNFDEKAKKLKEAIENIKDEIHATAKDVNREDTYLTAFTKYKNIQTLERGIVVELIDTIYVHEDGQITIDFSFADELKRVVDFIQNNRREVTVIKNEAIC